ncbi:MAG: hypothetical protein UC390_01200 [Peptococcaceae bacterium]|nr:hypothetical protein [Peptococcaceae bacterium]
MSSETKKVSKTKPSYWVHLVIGLLIMIGFPQLGPFEPITETGMWVAGILIGMVYLWSTLDSIWPSILGLLLFALYSGFLGEDVTGYNAVKTVFLNAVGSDIVITVILGMVLFGAIECAGCTKYLARFFLTRKIITGRPYVFLFIVFFCSYFVAGFTLPIASLLILWPLMYEAMNEFGYKPQDKIFWISIFGIYLAATLGQPMFPFKGAALVITGVFSKAAGMDLSYPAYIAYNFIMAILLLLIFLIFVKFILRPDVSKLKAVSPEMFNKNPLTPLLGNKPDFVFVGILLLVTLIMANFANNAGMATVMIPIAIAFQDMYPNIPMIAVCMSLGMIVFVGAVAPAASPYCAMLHAQKDKITFKQIETCALPMSLIAWLCYTFIGYPIASILFTSL